MTAADPIWIVATAYLVMVAAMTALWVLQRSIRNASIADVGWCAGLIGTVLWYVTQASGDIERKVLIAIMVSVYAGRLGVYILFNRVIGKVEDRRYQRLRMTWGDSAQIKMFGYFQLQAIAVAGFSLPFMVLIQNPRPPFALHELVGVMIWIIAILGEAAADWQLARFRAASWNHDRVCREGLWMYSRHPNYFCEWLTWWAYVVMAIGVPGWPLTLLGPIAMGWALLKVTGIPLAEQQALATRGEDYRRYQRTTNAFVPWFPKSGQASRD
jgi:steroid 5-alpha reductase family enzyme